jgi:hypothetical protein
MVCFHIGVNFFGGGTDVSDVEFGVVTDVVDIDDDVVVEVEDLGSVLAAAGKPENFFQGKLEAGAFSLVGLLDSEDGWDWNFGGVVLPLGIVDTDEAVDAEFRMAKLEVLESPTDSDFFTGLWDEGAGKGLLLGLGVRFVVTGCGCDVIDGWVEKAEFASELELENPCGSLPRSTEACLPVAPVGVGKGRPRFGESESDEGATATCIASRGKDLLDPGDGLSADWLAKGKIGALAPVDGCGSGLWAGVWGRVWDVAWGCTCVWTRDWACWAKVAECATGGGQDAGTRHDDPEELVGTAAGVREAKEVWGT